LFLQQLLIGWLNSDGELVRAFDLLAEPHISSGRIWVPFRGFAVTQHSCHFFITRDVIWLELERRLGRLCSPSFELLIH
jgi:hypothetical protein